MAQMKGNTSDLLYGYIKQRLKKIDTESEKKNNVQQSAPNNSGNSVFTKQHRNFYNSNVPSTFEVKPLPSSKDKKSGMTDEEIIKEYESIPEYNIIQRGFSGDSMRGTGRKNKSPEQLSYNKKQSLYKEYRNAKNRQISDFMSTNGITYDDLKSVFENDYNYSAYSEKEKRKHSANIKAPTEIDNLYSSIRSASDKYGLDINDIKQYYDALAARDFSEKARNFADEHEVLGTAASFGTKLIGDLGSYVTEKANYSIGKPIGSNEEANEVYGITGKMRGAVKENISDSIENPVLDSIANFGYDVGTSIGDMGVTLRFGGKKGSLPIMSISAGTNTLNEVKDRNLTPDQMIGTAIASGAIEAITEKIPLDNLFKIAKTQGRQSVKQILKNALKQAGTEASEEAVSELANTFVDNVINEDESVFNQSVNQYMVMYGLTRSQAENKAREDLASRTLQSALAGAVSGGIMAGAAGVYANSKNNVITPEQFQANNEYIQKLKEINDGKSYLDSYNDRMTQENAAKLVPLKNAGADGQNNSDAYTKMLERVNAVPREVLPDGVHTQEQLKVMEQYRDAVDSDILDFVRDVRTGANVRPQTVAMISDKAASEIQRLTGKEVYGNRVVLDSNGVRHIDKRHGVNGIADHSMADDADLARIEYVLDNYDTVRFDGDYADGYVDKNGKKAPIVVFEKRINGSYYVVEDVSDAKSKKNYVISAYKTKAANQSLDARAPQDTSENAAENTAFVKDSISNSVENVNEGQKKRSYNNTFVEKTDAPQELKNEFINNPDMYTSLSNAETKAKADGILNGNNTDAALTEFRKLLDEKKPEAVPLGYSLSKKLYQEGRIDESVQLVRDMSRALTESGQFSQAAAITMLNNDPEAAKRYIIRELDTLNQNGREKYGKKWNDFELSEADLKKFDSIEPGDTDAIKAAYQSIYDRISKQYPSTMTEKLMEFRRISMLLNVRTNVRNVVSNALLYPARWTADRVSALGEGVYSLIDPKYQRTQSFNPIRSQNAKKLASEAFETVKSELLGDNKYEDSKGAIRDRQMFKGSKLSQMLDTVTNGAITKANQAMGKNVNPSLMETARNFTYWLLEKGDNVFVRKNFESRMASYIDAQGITDLESIPADAYTLATQEALKATFKDDSAFANGLSEFRKMLNQTPGHFLGDAVMPFTKTPANLAMRGMDYSPAGVLSGLITLTSAKSNADIAKGITQLGQAATGTAAIALGYALAGAGIITGSLSDDKDEAQFQKQQGQLAYSVKTPYGYFTYDWAQPASIPIILGVTIYDSRNNDGDFINGLKNGFLASVDSWLELSPLQNISDIFGGYGSPAENVWDVLSTDLPLSYLPAQLGAAARIGDTTQRVTYDQNSSLNNLVNQAKSKIPGLSETLPVAYDTWGNPIKRQDSTAEAAFANLLNPGQFGNSNVAPIDGEISRLYDATGDAGVFPRKASWSAKVGGETIKLDNKQYSEYQRIMGTESYNMVSALIESNAYGALSDEQKSNAISELYEFSNALAKSEVLGYDVENSDTYKKTYSVYKEKGAEGVAVYLGIKQNQEGEKISDKFSAVDSIDLSDEDKGYYLSKMVDVSKAASEIQNSYGDAGLYTWYSLRSKADSDGNGNISNAEMVNQIIQTDMSYDDMLNYASVLYEDGKEKTSREKAEEAIQDAQRLNRIDSIINGRKSASSGNYQSKESSLDRINEIINSRYGSDKVSNDDSLKRIQSIIDNRNASLLTPLN